MFTVPTGHESVISFLQTGSLKSYQESKILDGQQNQDLFPIKNQKRSRFSPTADVALWYKPQFKKEGNSPVLSDDHSAIIIVPCKRLQ